MTTEAESPGMPAILPLGMPLEQAMQTQRAIRRLKAENKRLLAGRDILKKAAAFFAREAT